MAEQRFEGAVYELKDYLGNDYTLKVNGEIDRIDYTISTEEKKVYLRIVDYKTGKQEFKKKANSRGELFQYVLYREGLMNSGHGKRDDDSECPMIELVKEKVKELENNSELSDWDFCFREFRYAFPMDSFKSSDITIADKYIEGYIANSTEGVVYDTVY